MNGRTEKTRTYYACQGRSRRDADKPWHEEHPACVRVRENALNDAVHEFFATRIFGPDRQQLLAASMAELDSGDSAEQERQQRTMALRKLIKDLRVRQDRLLDELETPPEDMDKETYRAFRQRLHERFADLTKQLKACQEELDQLAAQPAQKDRQDAGLLDRLPRIGRSLRHSPREIQRAIYDAFRLQIVYSHRRHEAQLTVTITGETAARVTRVTRTSGNADLLCAPAGLPKDGTWPDQRFSAGSLVVQASFMM